MPALSVTVRQKAATDAASAEAEQALKYGATQAAPQDTVLGSAALAGASDADLLGLLNLVKAVALAAFRAALLPAQFSEGETPGGPVNGVNPTFSLAAPPAPAGSLRVYKNGARLRLTVDYSLAGSVLTLTVPPPGGSWLLADYRTAQ